MPILKKIEKWLARPFLQRLVYLLLLLLALYLCSSNASLSSARLRSATGLVAYALFLVPVLLIGAQLIWNKPWLWRLLCGLMIAFTIWLATLSLPQIINGAGSGAKTVVWGFGVVGFTILLVLALAFLNWMLLHMKPKK